MSRFQYRPYQFRDLVVALGHCRSEVAVELLLKIARGTGGLQNIEDAWIEAMGRLDVVSARQILLSYIDPQIPWVGISVSFDFRNAGRYAAFVAAWAQQDEALKQRLVALADSALTSTQKILLPAIFRALGDEDVMLAGGNLLQSTTSSLGFDRGLDTLFLERHPYNSSGAFSTVSRNAEQARAKLFRMVLDDASRRKAAFALLGQVEVWRIEYGRPQGEPRHPMIESGEPWPPLGRMT
jgi:hypothetical protein